MRLIKESHLHLGINDLGESYIPVNYASDNGSGLLGMHF